MYNVFYNILNIILNGLESNGYLTVAAILVLVIVGLVKSRINTQNDDIFKTCVHASVLPSYHP